MTSLVILPNSGVALPSALLLGATARVALLVRLNRSQTVQFDDNIFEPENVKIHSVVKVESEVIFQVPGATPKDEPEQFIEVGIPDTEIRLSSTDLTTVKLTEKNRRKMFAMIAKMANIQEAIDQTLSPVSQQTNTPESFADFDDDEDEEETEEFASGDDDDDDTDEVAVPAVGSDPIAVVDAWREEIAEIKSRISEYFSRTRPMADTSGDDEEEEEDDTMPLDDAIETLVEAGASEEDIAALRQSMAQSFGSYMANLMVINL